MAIYKVLSFDQSTQKTGWGLFEGGTLVEYGLIDLHKEKDSKQRWSMMVSNISQLILEKKPRVVVVEDTVLQRSPTTLKMLAQLQGAIIGCAQSLSLSCEVIYPTAWRKVLGIKQGKCKREELKAKAMAYVKDRCRLGVTEDEADAICIGFAYCKMKSIGE